jgi:hypothetical protein
MEDLFKSLKNFIIETVENHLQKSATAGIFDCLPEIASTQDVASVYKCSTDVILGMVREGLPHTHVGREYRFHKNLLIEWTRSGSKPIPCVKCVAADRKSDKIDDKIKETETNVSNFPAPKRELSHKSSNKLASLVANN